MTREEIIKEAQEQVNYRTPIHTEDFIHGYLVGAEPREKRIAELEKKLAFSEHDVKQNEQEFTEVYKKVEQLVKENEQKAGQLTKATDLLKKVIKVTWGEGWNYSAGVKVEAENFLKEKEKLGRVIKPQSTTKLAEAKEIIKFLLDHSEHNEDKCTFSEYSDVIGRAEKFINEE